MNLHKERGDECIKSEEEYRRQYNECCKQMCKQGKQMVLCPNIRTPLQLFQQQSGTFIVHLRVRTRRTTYLYCLNYDPGEHFSVDHKLYGNTLGRMTAQNVIVGVPLDACNNESRAQQVLNWIVEPSRKCKLLNVEQVILTRYKTLNTSLDKQMMRRAIGAYTEYSNDSSASAAMDLLMFSSTSAYANGNLPKSNLSTDNLSRQINETDATQWVFSKSEAAIASRKLEKIQREVSRRLKLFKTQSE